MGESRDSALAHSAEIDRVRRILADAVRQICPRWLADQYEDLVQAAVLRVVKILAAEEKNPPASSYLWKVAYSAVMDEIRRRRRNREVPVDQAVLAETAASPSGGRHAPGELRTEILKGLNVLEEPRRRAVVLYLYGFSLRDSARMLGWTTKRVDNERYRGLNVLRRFLDERGYRP